MFFSGCSTGHECVHDSQWICPIYIPEVQCDCKPGCRVDYKFVPFGNTVTMDTCGNTCSCMNLYGAVCNILFSFTVVLFLIFFFNSPSLIFAVLGSKIRIYSGLHSKKCNVRLQYVKHT